MDDLEENKVRKTVSLTHKQLGISGGVVAAMLMLNPVKQWFFTREEGIAQSHEIAMLRTSQADQFRELKVFIAQSNEDQMHKLERLNDKVVERIKDTEARATQNDQRQDRRMDIFEEVLNSSRMRKTN